MDWHCSVYVDGEISEDRLLDLITTQINGERDGEFIRSATLDVDVDENDFFDPQKKEDSLEGFIYFPFIVTVEPARPRPSWDVYLAAVSGLLASFKDAGLSFAAAADFEDSLPGQGRAMRG